jgi:ATP-dependent RNA helicase DDX24/MAK5
LPKSLTQYEIRVPLEDKEILLYQFLLQSSGRTLIFVNSIKGARRLDGLLRALDLNSRAIHAELQQKQRIKALESFRSSPIGVLVATDVAARGLDIPKINTVIHYDIARTPQLYIHRSGRTARASAIGTALSIVTPEDLAAHEAICAYLSIKRFDTWSSSSAGRVDESILLERVKLAKKVCGGNLFFYLITIFLVDLHTILCVESTNEGRSLDQIHGLGHGS